MSSSAILPAAAGRGALVPSLVGFLVGGLAGAGAGYLVGLHPQAPAGPLYFLLAGGVGGGLGAVVALWGAIALQLRTRDELDSTAGLAFVTCIVAGALGGAVGGASDGGPWDVLFGGLWGLLLGGGVGLLTALVGRFIGPVLMLLAGPVGLLGLASGAAAAVGAGIFHASDTNEMLPGALRMLAGALGGLAGVVAARLVGRGVPGRGSLTALGFALLATAGGAAWFLSQSPLVASVGHSGPVSAATLSPDGTVVVVSGDGNHKGNKSDAGEPTFVTLATGARRAVARGEWTSVPALAFTPDGKHLVGSALWEVDSGKELHRVKVVVPVRVINKNNPIGFASESEQPLWRVVALPGGKYALVGAGMSQDLGSDVAVFDLASGAVTRHNAHKDGLTDLGISRDGRHAVSGSRDKTLIRWEVDPEAGTLSQRKTLTAPEEVLAVALSPDGTTLAFTVQGIGTKEFGIHIWDATTGTPQRVLKGHTRKVPSLAFLPDGRLLSGSEDGTVRVWDTGSGAETRRLHVQARVAGLRLDAEGKRFLVAPEAGRLRVFQGP